MREKYINRIKNLEKKYDFLIKKRLGQNFLIDERIMTAMIEGAEVSAGDKILEIGPGLGFLTEKIVARAGKVVAIEKDKQLYEMLSRNFNNPKIKFIAGDVFSINLGKQGLSDLGYKIVSNIPYYLTSRLIRYFMENPIRPNVMIILVQREVADRVVSQAGQHSLLSLSVQFYGKPEKIMEIAKESFFPEPEVSSAMLKITMYKKPLWQDVDPKLFFRMLRISFASRRKQLHNNLAAGFRVSSQDIKSILKAIGQDPLVRAQALDLKTWHDLYLNLLRKGLI